MDSAPRMYDSFARGFFPIDPSSAVRMVLLNQPDQEQSEQFPDRFATPLYNAPVTHVTSFVVLHEITAIVPLFGLAGAFHYWDWLPPYFSEGKWVHNGMEKFGNYFRKKGWLGEEGRGRWKWWGRGEGSVRIVVEFATAYAITKAFLPLRVILSIWATPWFAKTATVPIGRWVKRLLTKIPRKNPTNVSAAKDASAPTKAIPTITSNRIISNEKGGAVR
ncbi:MAG: hypothetical protein M1814_002904 [Vezdaea aestivalis]|nr:MAG: hypothetical protein M1814_002904 [Vezdaea aestivalis]